MGIDSFVHDFINQTQPARFRIEYRFDGKPLCRKYDGVDICLDITKDTVELVEISLPVSIRGKGIGSKTLGWLQKMTISHGIKIVVIPEPFNGCFMDKEQLSDWYRKHWFIVD